MRRTVVAVAAFFLVCGAAVAQPANRVGVYATNLGFGYSKTTGHEWTGGGTFSYSRFWNSRFATEFAAGAQHEYDGYTLYNPDGSVRDSARTSYTIYPIDVLAQYHFQNETRWKPYVGAGFQYVQRPSSWKVGADYNFAPEINGGVFFNVGKSWGIAFDFRASTAWENWTSAFLNRSFSIKEH